MSDPRRYRRRAAWGRTAAGGRGQLGCILVAATLFLVSVSSAIVVSYAITHLR